MKKIAVATVFCLLSILFVLVTDLQFSNLITVTSVLGWSVWVYLFICYNFVVTNIVKAKNQRITWISGISFVIQFIIFSLFSYIIPHGVLSDRNTIKILCVCLLVLELITIVVMIRGEETAGSDLAFDNLSQNKNIAINNALLISLIAYVGFINAFSGIVNHFIIVVQIAIFYFCFFVFFSFRLYKKYNIGIMRYIADLLGVLVAFVSVNCAAYLAKEINFSTILFQLYFMTPYIVTFINIYEKEAKLDECKKESAE